jgi:hypothetical protein
MWVVFVSCFVFLAIKKIRHRAVGDRNGVVLLGGFAVARKRARKSKRSKNRQRNGMSLHLAQSIRPISISISGGPGEKL